MSAKMGTTRNKGKGVVLFIFANLLPGKRNKCLTIFLFSFVSVCVSLPNWVRRCGNGRFACGRIPIRRMGTNDLHLYLKTPGDPIPCLLKRRARSWISRLGKSKELNSEIRKKKKNPNWDITETPPPHRKKK